MSNNEIVDTVIAGLNGILDKNKRWEKTVAVRKMITSADCLTKSDKQYIWDKVGKRI